MRLVAIGFGAHVRYPDLKKSFSTFTVQTWLQFSKGLEFGKGHESKSAPAAATGIVLKRKENVSASDYDIKT